MTELVKRLFQSEKGIMIYMSALKIIKEHSMDKMLEGGAVVGFSGGADSVMLLCVLKKYSEEEKCGNLCAVHLNHMIRGTEADRDEAFSKSFCASLGVEFISVNRDVPSEAKEMSKGLEEAAREIRYSVFNEIIQGREDVKCISVAHNSTDNLETVIFNMMRGAGTRGLSGISPVRDNVIRPLLYSSKKDIVDALNAAGIPFVVDSTNFETEYKRNYIRNEILPMLSRLSDNPEGATTRLSSNLRSDADFIDRCAENFLSSRSVDSIPRADLASLHPSLASRVIYLMARHGGAFEIEHVHITKIIELIDLGKDFSIDLHGRVSFICQNSYCRVGVKPKPDSKKIDMKLSFGENYVAEIDRYIYVGRTPINFISSNVYKISIQTSIDFDIIKGDLSVRSKRDGDSYRFGGMTHKLKKLFNDRSIPVEERAKIPVLCDTEGILWVPGFKVRDGGDKNSENRVYIAILQKKA